MPMIEKTFKLNFSHHQIAGWSRALFSIYMTVFFCSVLYSHNIIFASLPVRQSELFRYLLFFALLCCAGTFSRRFHYTSLLLIYFIFVLINVNRFSIYQFHNSFIGLACLLFCLIPFKSRFDEDDQNFLIKLQFITLAFLSFSYTLSGLSKLLNAGWTNGNVSSWMIENYVMRPFWVEHFRQQISELGVFFTWPTLFLETAPFFLFCYKPLRPFAWFIGVLLNLGILLLIQLSQVSLILILFHVLTFNPDWFKIGREVR